MEELNVSQPWFGHVKSGRKTVEGRLDKGKFADVRAGTVLLIRRSSSNSNSNSNSSKPVVAVVADVRRYDSFESYLSAEGLNRTLPGVQTIADGVSVYRQFYTEQDERKHGVLAIQIVPVSTN